MPKFASFCLLTELGSMYSHNENEVQTLQSRHHPNKHPQADTRCLPPHNHPNCQPVSDKGRILWGMEDCCCLDLMNKNHRPISNLPFISKLVEKCMLKQLQNHYKNHNLLPDFQPAYRKHYSRDKPHKAHQWCTVVSGKTAHDSNCNSRPIGSIEHCGPWHPSTNSGTKLCFLWKSSNMVSELSKTMIVQ